MAAGTLQVAWHTHPPNEHRDLAQESLWESSERQRQRRARRHCKASLLPLTPAALGPLSQTTRPESGISQAHLLQPPSRPHWPSDTRLSCLSPGGSRSIWVRRAATQSPRRLRSLGSGEGLRAVKEAGVGAAPSRLPGPRGPAARVPSPGGVLPSCMELRPAQEGEAATRNPSPACTVQDKPGPHPPRHPDSSAIQPQSEPPPTHTQARTHMHARTRAHTHTGAHTHARTHTGAHTHAHTHTLDSLAFTSQGGYYLLTPGFVSLVAYGSFYPFTCCSPMR